MRRHPGLVLSAALLNFAAVQVEKRSLIRTEPIQGPDTLQADHLVIEKKGGTDIPCLAAFGAPLSPGSQNRRLLFVRIDVRN
jgi:hypothetical protein